MFTYEADERDTKELSKVEYFISFCLVSYVHVVRVCSVHYSFTVIELKENDSYLYLMSIFCYLDRFKTPTKSEILFLYSNIFTVFPKKEYMPEEYKSLLGYDKYKPSWTTLKMKAASSSEILVHAPQSTRRRNQEDWLQQQYRCDNLKDRTEFTTA